MKKEIIEKKIVYVCDGCEKQSDYKMNNLGEREFCIECFKKHRIEFSKTCKHDNLSVRSYQFGEDCYLVNCLEENCDFFVEINEKTVNKNKVIKEELIKIWNMKGKNKMLLYYCKTHDFNCSDDDFRLHTWENNYMCEGKFWYE